MPPQASPPSRSSTASNSPVEAPEGTAAQPRAPESSTTSTSTVGLPRESRIWRAWMRSILAIERETLSEARYFFLRRLHFFFFFAVVASLAFLRFLRFLHFFFFFFAGQAP